MRSFRLILSVVVLLMSVISASFTAHAAQSEASPVAIDAPDDLHLPGIDSQLLGTGTSTAPLAGMPRMILERISLPAGSALPAHTAGGPELLVGESGTPTITDSFGFAGQIAPGSTFLDAGAQYTLSNPGTEDASALRLSVLAGMETVAASPVAADATVTVLIDSPLDDPRIQHPTLTIAQLTWHPGAASQPLDHGTAIGLVVLDGTLFAKSPSGFDGQLAPNTPVVFPASTPLEARAGEDGPASALIVSITDGASPIVSVLEPTPTPNPTTTPTLEPSITPTSTETQIPSATSTPSITPTPSPTPDLNTAQGSVLQLGDNWRAENGSLLLNIKDLRGNIWNGSPEWSAYLIYTNMGTTRQDFIVPAGFIRIKDDNGDDYEPYIDGGPFNRTAIGSVRVIVEGGEDFTFEFGFHGTGNDGNIFISVDEFGPISAGKWGFTFSQGKMLPLAETAQITFASTEELSVESGLTQFSSADLPQTIDSLTLSETGTRSQSEITSTFPNPSEADALFTQWGWSGSNYEVFVAPNGATGTDGVYQVDIGIHQLAGVREAEEALQYFRVARINLLGLWDIEAAPMGSMSRAVIGPSGDGGYEASVYVALGSQVVRVTAFSWNDYPLDTAVSITRQVIGT